MNPRSGDADTASSPPDPRPQVRRGDDGAIRVVGVRCSACGYVCGLLRRRCPDCAGVVHEQAFGPGGEVWSVTVVRLAVPGRTPPWALAYVDVDDGPRVLAHVRGPNAGLGVGTRVQIAGLGEHGDLEVQRA